MAGLKYRVQRDDRRSEPHKEDSNKEVLMTCSIKNRAFVQWFLGLEPTVRTESGKCLTIHEDSQVVLTVRPQIQRPKSRKRPRDAIDAETDDVLGHIVEDVREIVFHDDSKSKKWAWQGLVDVETWISYQFAVLHDSFPEISQDKRLADAIDQALSLRASLY